MRKLKDKYKSRLRMFVVLIVIIILGVWAVPTVLKDMKSDSADLTGTKTATTNVDKNSSEQKDTNNTKSTSKANESSKTTTVSNEDTEFTIWLDSWVWLPLAAANGGNETTPDSFYGQKGYKIHIINNESDEEKAEAFINGEIDGMAATINRLSLLSGTFYGNTEYVVPYLMDHSNGGDGIVSRVGFDSIESLKDAKVAVGKESVSHVMLISLYQMSNMNDAEFKNALGNIVTYSSSEEAAQAYLNGEVDAVATWEPFLSECAKSENSKLLFSTATSSTLIMDAFILNKEYAEANQETVSILIDGMLNVVEDLKAGENKEEYYSIFRKTFPAFEDSSDDELDTMFTKETVLMDWHENITAFENNSAKNIFKDMCNVWNVIGYETVPSDSDTIFDDKFLKSLSSKYQNTPERTKSEVVADDSILNEEALITKSVTVSFKPYTAEFVNEKEASEQLSDFIEVAKILDGALIRIEGNVSSHTDSEELRVLSELRAETVRDFVAKEGIDSRRMFVVGNGASKQKYPDPKNSDEYEMNRSVDLMFIMTEEVYGN